MEGSISTPEEEERIKRVRESSRFLVAIGACAVSGGIQSARNFEGFTEVYSSVYTQRYEVNPMAKPVSDFVKIDLEIRGCPINKDTLKRGYNGFLHGKSLQALPYAPLCFECKRKGNVCVVVACRLVCLGPITVAGYGALCPSYKL